MTSFEREFKKLLGIEGEYSDHKDDSGGATRWGVTEFLARRYGYKGDMRELPIELAQNIYRTEFWDRLLLDQVDALSPHIASEMFDTEVNLPFASAPTFLQRALRLLNRQGRDYPDIAVDGRMGPATLNALSAFLAFRGRVGRDVLLRMLNVMQGNHYIELAERREKDETFVLGWFLNRVFVNGE